MPVSSFGYVFRLKSWRDLLAPSETVFISLTLASVSALTLSSQLHWPISEKITKLFPESFGRMDRQDRNPPPQHEIPRSLEAIFKLL